MKIYYFAAVAHVRALRVWGWAGQGRDVSPGKQGCVFRPWQEAGGGAAEVREQGERKPGPGRALRLFQPRWIPEGGGPLFHPGSPPVPGTGVAGSPLSGCLGGALWAEPQADTNLGAVGWLACRRCSASCLGLGYLSGQTGEAGAAGFTRKATRLCWPLQVAYSRVPWTSSTKPSSWPR